MPEAIKKTNEEIYLLLTIRNSRRQCPITARVIARVQIALDIAEELSK